MISFPNAKINLGLSVLSKRSDGFHELETIFYPIRLKDGLEIIGGNKEHKEVAFSTSGIEINGDSSQNICLKAYQLLKNDFPRLPSIQMHLHKAIPIGAGLGGGSADGAFTLLLSNEKFNLQLSEEQLLQYALKLGSDCAFFIINKPCHAKGRGEILEQLELNLDDYKIVVVYPNIHINTGWAFSQLQNFTSADTLKEIIEKPVQQWRDLLKNDFEEVVFAKFPAIKQIKDQLYNAGAIYASMSGSGSTVYGLFSSAPSLTALSQEYFIRTV